MVIVRDGGDLRLYPVSEAALALLAKRLSYVRQTRSYKPEWEEDEESGKRRRVTRHHVEKIRVNLYVKVQGPDGWQVKTLAGYLDRIERCLRRAKIDYTVVDKTRAKPLVLKPDWSRVNVSWREGQRETLEKLLSLDFGQVQLPTGVGKTFTICLIPAVLPRNRIMITTRHQQPLLSAYERLLEWRIPVSVDCSSLKKNVAGARVTCCSLGRLDNYDPQDYEILILDESHEAASDIGIATLRRFAGRKMYAFSANYRDRSDKADFELEALFGPRIASLSYQDAVGQNSVAQIGVVWSINREGPSLKASEPKFLRDREGIWLNQGRNELIQRLANQWSQDNTQMLITVSTVLHAVILHNLLPDFEMVYSQMSPQVQRLAIRNGWLPRRYQPLTSDRLLHLSSEFARGRIRRAIATPVWKRGVDFRQLSVLLRAEGGSSKISNTQVPGRLSRLAPEFNKDLGILLDIYDVHDKVLEGQSLARRKIYESFGWPQQFPQEWLEGV